MHVEMSRTAILGRMHCIV